MPPEIPDTISQNLTEIIREKHKTVGTKQNSEKRTQNFAKNQVRKPAILIMIKIACCHGLFFSELCFLGNKAPALAPSLGKWRGTSIRVRFVNSEVRVLALLSTIDRFVGTQSCFFPCANRAQLVMVTTPKCDFLDPRSWRGTYF